MFGLFSKKKENECPISNETRLWMEEAFVWLIQEFGKENIMAKTVLLPTKEHFPIQYDGSLASLTNTAAIIANQMEIDINEVNLDVYEQNIQEFTGDAGYRIWTEIDKNNDEVLATGLYFDKNDEGKYDIFIEKKNLSDPENLVATLAHEFSHIKLLGENRTEFNDELLTDLTTVVFGLGIFNANSAFKEYKSYDSFGHNSAGYLNQPAWGYALALLAYLRQEENPDWIKYLTPNIQSDLKKSSCFIYANHDKIF